MAQSIELAFERAVGSLRLDAYCSTCGGPRRAGAGVVITAVGVEPPRCSACDLELAPDGGCAWGLEGDGTITLSVVVLQGTLAVDPVLPA